MNLNEYLASPGALTVAELRELIGAKSDAQLRQWQHGYAERRPSPENCVSLEQATGGVVTRRDLRPDDWQKIWPELIQEQQGPVFQRIQPHAAVKCTECQETWDGVDNRHVTTQTLDPIRGLREIDRPGGFPTIEGV
jgi:DNA-binding transcriptional regulator YdaS (Cro superfamily)